MFRLSIGLSLILLVSCGGSTAEMTPEDLSLETALPEDEISEPIPVTFVAGDFEAALPEMGFDERQSLGNTALAIVEGLEPTVLDTYPASGSATYHGLIQLDYNGHPDDRQADSYLVASSLGKMSLAVEFGQFSNGDFVSFEGKADSFVLDDGTPLTGEYELFWGPGLVTTDEFTGRSENFIVYMDGQLSAGNTQYSGDANIYFDVFGDEGDYLIGQVSGELQIWDIRHPTEGTIYGDTLGTVVANRE